MISLPISVLTTKEEIFISLSTIQEHQKFCKSLLKSYHSFEKKKTEGKNKIKFKFEEDEFFQTQKKQYQEEIIKWFGNLKESEKIKICTIQNKWLVNLLLQMYLISTSYDNIGFKPIYQMEKLFKDNKNFSHIEENGYNNNNYKEQTLIHDLSLYENFFSIQFPTSTNLFSKKENEKRKLEKEFIDQIKILSLDENEQLDTLTLGKELLEDIEKFKYYLNFFSKEKYFQEWLLPIQENNIYNFTFPNWMHNNNKLTIFEIIAGYFEQQILLHYEYFYYSKKIYEYPYHQKIFDLYEENKKLLLFVNENYSTFGNSDPEKKEFISRMEIREIVFLIKCNNNYKNKINYIEGIYEISFPTIVNNKNKEGILNSKLDFSIYEQLYNEMINSGVDKVIEHITFANFLDVINCRNIVFSIMRKRILDDRCNKVLDEITQEGFLSSNSNKKKNKNKKKKKKNKKKDDNEENNDGKTNINIKEEDKKVNINIDKINEKNEKIEGGLSKEEIKDIKEVKVDELKQEIKNIQIINNDYKKNENINIEIKNNDVIEDLKQINIEYNNDKDSNLHEKEDDDIKELKIENKKDETEDIKNIENIFGEDNNSKKNKTKGIFLYPTKTNKKKNKRKKKQCVSAKKINENKMYNEDKKFDDKDKKSDKNSPSCDIKNEKTINININSYSSSLLDKNDNLNNNNNLYSTKSQMALLSEHESFSLENDFDISENNNKQINIDNNDLSKNNTDKINNLKNINCEPKIIPNNITINMNSMNPDPKLNSLENIKNNNFSKSITNISYNNNFINYTNMPIISNIYTPYTPSEKFFESLTSEIKNYNTVTLKNISLLNPLRNKYLNEIENLIKTNLNSKYEIKYGHYGSYFTNLSIEGSDVDILIYYKNKNVEKNKDFFDDLLLILKQNEDKFESIQPILTASVPVIKLQIFIKNEIKDLKLEHMSYLEGYWEFDKIKFDITFTQNEQEYLHSQQVVEYINKSLNTYPIISDLLLILKRYFKIMRMNKSFHGGLSSYSLYLLIVSFCKKFPTVITSKGKALFSFLGMFSFFEFDKLGIDIENSNLFYFLNTNSNVNNYNLDENIIKKEINIIDPLTKLNVAKSSFKVDEIQTTFRTAYDFLRTEGCYYDYAVFVHKTGYDNDFFKQIKNNNDIFDTTDFKIIKKMFTLNKKGFFYDFFAN